MLHCGGEQSISYEVSQLLIAALHPGKDKHTARSRAILTFSALAGAMVLARAVSDEALSREILKTVAELLKDSAKEHQ
jgi:TetR/AcrR family transcriptional repressor of nem operon